MIIKIADIHLKESHESNIDIYVKMQLKEKSFKKNMIYISEEIEKRFKNAIIESIFFSDEKTRLN